MVFVIMESKRVTVKSASRRGISSFMLLTRPHRDQVHAADPTPTASHPKRRVRKRNEPEADEVAGDQEYVF